MYIIQLIRALAGMTHLIAHIECQMAGRQHRLDRHRARGGMLWTCILYVVDVAGRRAFVFLLCCSMLMI
jgi:hypothetical protein